jgi:glucosamine--fructose-6-phosphate aminotransferase (isomerizing)
MTGSLMQQEMGQQPEVLRRLISRRAETVGAVREVAPRDLRGVLLVARGSSDNAALHARYLMELATGRPVVLAAPSLWTRYGARTALDDWVVVAVSQSGNTPEIIETVRRMRDCGARSISVTNDASSDLAAETDLAVALQAGEERAIPATKTVTASMLVLAHVAAGLGEVPWAENDEARLPGQVAKVLEDSSAIEEVLAVLDRPQTVHMGRSYSLAVALESALKFKETTLRPARAYATGDFLHGPVAAVGDGDVVVGYAASGPTYADVLDVLGALHGRGASTLVVTDRPDEVAAGIPALGVPAGMPEPLVSVLLTVRAQQLARALTVSAGLDPDRPEGLSKVTVTD